MVHQDQQCLWSTRMRVPSPAWCSGLSFWGYCSCGLGRNCGSDLIPGPRMHTLWGGQKRKKKVIDKQNTLKKKKKKEFRHSETCTGQGSISDVWLLYADLASSICCFHSQSLFFFNGCTHSIWKFLGQELNLSCSCNLQCRIL